MTDNIFPLLLPAHLVFALIGTGYFVYRFIKYRRPYQILLGLCIILTLPIRFLPDMKDKNLAETLYTVSMYVEFAILIIGFVWAIVDSVRAHKKRKTEKLKNAAYGKVNGDGENNFTEDKGGGII